jgi:hypothetical protein
MFETSTELEPDPVIEFYKKAVDRAAIRENLQLTVEQRFDKLMRLNKIAEARKSAVKRNDDAAK